MDNVQKHNIYINVPSSQTFQILFTFRHVQKKGLWISLNKENVKS
jgi:hypothetical protein